MCVDIMFVVDVMWVFLMNVCDDEELSEGVEER